MKFVINRTDAIGDTLLTLPMAKKLKTVDMLELPIPAAEVIQ